MSSIHLKRTSARRAGRTSGAKNLNQGKALTRQEVWLEIRLPGLLSGWEPEEMKLRRQGRNSPGLTAQLCPGSRLLAWTVGSCSSLLITTCVPQHNRSDLSKTKDPTCCAHKYHCQGTQLKSPKLKPVRHQRGGPSLPPTHTKSWSCWGPPSPIGSLSELLCYLEPITACQEYESHSCLWTHLPYYIHPPNSYPSKTQIWSS